MAIYRRSEDIRIINEVKTGTIDMKYRMFSAAVNIDEHQTINTHSTRQSGSSADHLSKCSLLEKDYLS